MGWEYFIYAIVMMVVSYLIAPKPKTSPPQAQEFQDVPTAQEGESIVVLFGTRDIKSPSVVWYGDVRTEDIKK